MVSFDLFRKVLAFTALFCVIGIPLPSPSYAADTGAIDNGCDPDFLDALRARAWGEAQREMMINREMIWKPDSVLALGCYNKWMSALASSASFKKSTSYIGGSSFGGDIGMVGSVGGSFGSFGGGSGLTGAASSYLGSAFNHKLGGGRTGNDNSSYTTNCNAITTLWNYSHCENLELEQIISLSDAQSKDPRKKPASCHGTGGEWTKVFNTIRQVGAGVEDSGKPRFDAMNLFSNIVSPLSNVSGSKCSKGIPTGVMIGGSDSTREIVCPNPGCSSTGGSNPQCCKSGSTSDSCSGT